MPSTARGWVIPTDGGSSDSWGNILNTQTLVSIDTDVTAIETTAAAALAKAGGTLTGRVDALTATAAVVAKGTVSGAQSLDCSLGQGFTATLNGATTFSFTNVPAALFGFVLNLSVGNSGVTWPASVKWGAGAAPTLSAGTDVLGFVTFNSGTTWYGTSVCLAAA
jgi:hypothetical protein